MRKSRFLQNSKDMLHRSFKPDKCKTSLRLVVSRLKLMKNKKEVQVKVYRREVAQLLESGQDQTARIKVEHVVREEKMTTAYELISLYSEIVMTRMPIVESQKNCPIDLKEAITSLIFASPRCVDIPELADVQKHFTAKYGKDFVSAAIELRPDCGVSHLLVEKLSAKAPDGQTKLKILSAIAEEHKIEWEPKSFGEKESTASTPQTFQAQSPRHEPSQVLQGQIHYQPSKVEQNDRFSHHSAAHGENRPYYTESHQSGSHLRRDSSEFAGEQLQTHSSNSYDFDRRRRLVSDHLQGVKFKNPGGNQGGYGPHLKRDSSEPAGDQLQKHSSNSYDSDGHRRSDSDHLQGVKFKNPGGNTERYNQDGYGPQIAGEQLRKHSSDSYDSDRHRRSDSDHLQGVKFNNSGGNAERPHQGSYGPHLKRDSSEFAGEQLQKHSSDSYDPDRHCRSDSDHLQGVKSKNPGGNAERSNQGGYGPHLKRDSSEFASSNSYDSDRHRRSDSDNPQGVKFKNPGGNAKRPHQGGYGPHLKRDSSEFAGEQLQKHSSNSYDSDRHRRLESDHLQGVKYKNSGGSPERSHQGGYGRMENSNRGNNLQINDHVVDGSYGHSSFDAGKSSRKSMYKEETTKPNSIAKSQYKGSEYRSDDHDRLNSEDFHHIQAVNSRKSKYKEGAAKPDEYLDDVHKISNSEKFHNIHTDTSRTGSGSSVFAVFDEEGSDHEDISFSTGPKYDDQDSDSDSMPLGKAAPSGMFRIPSPHNFGFSGSKLPEKSVFDQSSHEFPVISETSAVEFKFDDQLPFDDSDGPSSEGEDSMYESLHTSKNYLETIPGNKGQIIPSPRLSYKEQGNKGGVKKPHLKSTLDEPAYEVPTQTGGLRHKQYALPPRRSTRVNDASSTLENPVEERSGLVTTHSQVSTEVEQNANSRKAFSISHDDLDTDSSEDERSAQGSGFGRERYTQPAIKGTETNSNSKISVPYFESDSDDDPPRPIQTSAGRKHMSIGFSRRTKVTPSSHATTPKVQPKHGDAKSSNISSGRKSAFSSNDEPDSRRKKDATTPGPKLQQKCEDPDDSDFSSDGSGSNDKRTNDLDFNSGRRATLSSYGSHFTEETESLRRRSGQSRNSEQASSTRESSEHILEPLKPTPGREDLQQPPSGKSVPPPPPPPVAPHPPPPPPPPPILIKTNAPPAPTPPGKSAPPPPPPPVKTNAPPAPPPPRKSAPPPPPPPGKSAPPPPPPPGKSAPPLPPPRASPAGKGPSTEEDEADSHKTKLKPFFWDKVTADPDGSMVWHQLNSGSFRFNEEKIESLFGSASAEKNQNEMKKHSSNQDRANDFIQIIGQKKAHNFAILLKGLRVTAEEVYDALQEGNELPAELIETVLKMAPTAEEELKLRQYSGEISRLGIAERFLKVLVDIPFAFKRLESLLFIYTFQEDQLMVKESFATLEAACIELRENRLFLKLLEAVLKTGNRMNDGTFRGRAQAFKLDTLLKLSDVRGADGKTTLLHFVVQEIIQSEGIRALRASRKGGSFSSIKSDDLVEDSSDDSEESYRDVGLQVVSTLGNELQNVKKAAILNAEGLTGTVVKLGHRFKKARDFLNSEMKNVDEENGFNQALMLFVQDAEPDIMWLLQEEKRIMALVKKTGDYFHGNTGKDEGLRIFIVVRDFLLILDKVCREVKNAPKKSFATTKGKDLTEKPLQPPPDPRQPTLDPRQRLITAIKDRKMENSSSDDDF